MTALSHPPRHESQPGSARAPSSAAEEGAPLERDKASSPLRTCTGCRKRDDAAELVRVVLADGDVVVDLGRKSFGRGAWVHPRVDCIRRACKGGLAQGFRAAVSIDPQVVVLRIREAAERRVEALIAAARGARRLAFGADAVKEACQSGQAALIVVAGDLGNLREQGWLEPWVVSGKALVWGTKEILGRILARSEVGILVVTEIGIGRAVSRAIACAQLPLPDTGRSGVSGSMEVR